MAKKSAILRDQKRRKLYEKYQAKRAALKAAGDLEGLQKLPRNPVAICATAVSAGSISANKPPTATSRV